MNIPWMSPNEIVTILKLLKPHHIMLEWGAGGSTVLFSPFVKQYCSIEHDKGWFNGVINELKTKKIGHNVVLHCVKVLNKDYKEYVKTIEDFKVEKFDIVLIDGRRRIDCAIEVLPYITKDSFVLLHDSERERYKSILNYYNIIGKIDNLYILNKNNGKNKHKYN